MTMPMQWALRRRMMMAASGGVDVANLLIQGSCTFTDYGVVTMGDGNDYRLLAITQSGNLVLSEPVNIEVCVVGGGANGFEGNWAPGYGGAGAYMKNQVIEEFESGEVVVGAAQGASSIAGVSVAAVSKNNGGTGGGGCHGTNYSTGGTGDGLSKYPFGDTSYELWLNKPHCAGGGGAADSVKADENDYPDGAWFLYTGGDGGSNGSNGGNPKYDSLSSYEYAPGGSGGSYGGGNGQGVGIGGSPSNATYYGSGGGSTRSGYQGIVYVRIPVDQAAGGGGAPIGAPISDLPLGALINVGTDGGAGTPNYEIVDKDNLVSGGVVMVRKNIYSNAEFGSTASYPDGTLDNLIKTTIYNKMPQQLRNKMMDVPFKLSGSGDITRKMFAPTYTMVGFGNNSDVAEGKALQLYTSKASRIKKLNGSAVEWWLSSQNSSYMAWYVSADGSAYGGNFSHSYGVVPAFVIPSKTPYNATPNTDGSYNLIL